MTPSRDIGFIKKHLLTFSCDAAVFTGHVYVTLGTPNASSVSLQERVVVRAYDAFPLTGSNNRIFLVDNITFSSSAQRHGIVCGIDANDIFSFVSSSW